MIWLAIIVPIMTSLILLAWFPQKVVWWEFLILFAVTPLIIIACIASGESSMTTDKEYWGSYVIEARYYEDWNEKVSCRHPIYQDVASTDSKGNTTYTSVYVGDEHFYDVDYHDEYWRLYDNIGKSYSTSERKFIRLTKRWDNRTFQDLRRSYHTDDGDMYKTLFDKKDPNTETITTIHSYKNKVQASSSVFNFPEVKDATGLHQYPHTNNLYAPSIIGTVHDFKKANRILDIHNAKLGSSHQVRVWFLFFHNVDMSVALTQENYWKGGNKNEFVVCIGLDREQQVMWCKPFTWCEVDELAATVRNEVAGQEGKIDTVKLAEFTVNEVKNKWQRKEFKDFEYLKVNLPSWCYITVWVMTILVNIGIGVFVVKNDVDEDSRKKGRRR